MGAVQHLLQSSVAPAEGLDLLGLPQALRHHESAAARKALKRLCNALSVDGLQLFGTEGLAVVRVLPGRHVML